MTSQIEIKPYPFTHLIIDSFLSESLFDKIKSEIENIDFAYDNVNGDFRCISRINRDGREEFSEGLSSSLLRSIFEEKNEFLIEQLHKLAPKKVELYDFTELRLQKAQANYKSGPHTDSSKKLLSVVIYLHPEREEGTQLYETKSGSVVGECEWRQNRAFIFSRLENKTWHSWASKGNSGRYVLVYTLMTHNADAALKSEGLLSSFYSLKKNVGAVLSSPFK